jgi:hypothetical protein
MDELTRLIAMMEIRQLKARYFLCVDTKRWDDWIEQVWTPDAELHVPSLREEPFRGAAQIAEWSAGMLADCVSIHHGYTPIIDIVSDREATGIWMMDDMVLREGATGDTARPAFFHGWGYYHERYVRTAKGWRIAASRLTRSHTETRA